jgi:internalin A
VIRSVPSSFGVILLALIPVYSQDTHLPQARTGPLLPIQFGSPDEPKTDQSAPSPDDNPFNRPPLETERKPTPPPRDEGIIDKIKRLGGRVEVNPSDGTLRVSYWSGNFTDDDLVALAALGNLGSIKLERCPITDRGIDRLAKNQRLFCVDLAQSAITDDGVKVLAKLPKLRSLNLAGTKTTDEGITSLKAHVCLRELNLSDTGVSNAGVQALSGNENLTSLDIFGTRVDNAGMVYVGRLRHLRDLRVNQTVSNEALAAIEGLVELSRFEGPREISDIGLYHLRHMKQLSTLIGRMSRVTDNGLRSIRALPYLTEIRLDGSQITDEGMVVVGEMHELVILSLRNTKVTDAGIRHVCNLKRLRSLDCMNTSIGDSCLAHIGTLKNLFHLDLAGTRVTNAGMKSLTNLTTLRELDVTATQVDDEGMGSIAKLPNLVFLGVSKTAVGDRGLKELVGMPALRDVHVQSTNVTEKGAEVLWRRGVSVHDVPHPVRTRKRNLLTPPWIQHLSSFCHWIGREGPSTIETSGSRRDATHRDGRVKTPGSMTSRRPRRQVQAGI